MRHRELQRETDREWRDLVPVVVAVPGPASVLRIANRTSVAARSINAHASDLSRPLINVRFSFPKYR